MATPAHRPLDDQLAFSVFRFGEEEDTYLYTVTRLGDFPLTFTAVVSKAQVEFAEPSDIEAIRPWFERRCGELPLEGGIIYIDLRQG